jgi:hypothetical protein
MGALKGSLAASRKNTTPAARAAAGRRGERHGRFEHAVPRATSRAVRRKRRLREWTIGNGGRAGKILTRWLQSAIAGLLCRRSGCRAGQRNASRGSEAVCKRLISAYFGLIRGISGKSGWRGRLEPGGSSGGPCAIRARGETVRAAGASRHRAARARESWVIERKLSARAAGKLVAVLLGKQRR